MSPLQLILLFVAVLLGCLFYAFMLLRISKRLHKAENSKSKLLVPVLIGFVFGILLLILTISSI